MEYYKNGKSLAKAFTNGATEGVVGTGHNPGNLKIGNNQVIHYMTPILERCDDGTFILNVSRYSQVTGIIQKWIKNETLNGLTYKEAHGVEYDHVGSLAPFVKEK